MPTRVLGLSVRMAILVVFAIFFVAPILWLVLAPTKSDHALILDSPFTFGSFHQVALAWKHLDHFSNHVYRHWIINSLVYSCDGDRDHARRRHPSRVRARARADSRAAS